DQASRCAYLHVFVAARKHFHVIAIEQHAQLLANLRHAAPQRDAALADVRLAQRFMLWPEYPGQQRHHAEQRHGHQQLALHAESPNVAPTERAACTTSLPGSTYFIFSRASIFPDFRQTMRPK